MKNKFVNLWITAIFLLFQTILSAQQIPEDPINDAFFPPELVIKHRQAIGLSEEQTETIIKFMKEAQIKFSGLQWDLMEATDKLQRLIKMAKPDERAVLGQLDDVLRIEKEIKRTQIALMVRIKSNLGSRQQEQLQALRSKQ